MRTLEDQLVFIIAEEVNGGCLVNEPLGYDKFRPLAKRLLKEFAVVPVASNNSFNLTTAENDWCTRPDVVDCHAKGGTGGRCMNGVRCPPLQVK